MTHLSQCALSYSYRPRTRHTTLVSPKRRKCVFDADEIPSKWNSQARPTEPDFSRDHVPAALAQYTARAPESHSGRRGRLLFTAAPDVRHPVGGGLAAC